MIYHKLYTETFVVAISKKSYLNAHTFIENGIHYIDLLALKNESLILNRKQSAIRSAAIDIISKVTNNPNVFLESESLDIVISLVENNIGITIISKKQIDLLNDRNINFYQIEDIYNPSFEAVVEYSSNFPLNNASKEFISMLLEKN